MTARAKSGFTLFEVMAVVMIMGALSVAAVPLFSSTAQTAVEANVAVNLGEVRTAIERYKIQHSEAWPVLFATQLLIATDEHGLPGFQRGPYLMRGFPPSPVNGDSTVKEVVKPLARPDDTSGWLLVITTGEFRANSSGTAPSGKRWFEL